MARRWRLGDCCMMAGGRIYIGQVETMTVKQLKKKLAKLGLKNGGMKQERSVLVQSWFRPRLTGPATKIARRQAGAPELVSV